MRTENLDLKLKWQRFRTWVFPMLAVFVTIIILSNHKKIMCQVSEPGKVEKQGNRLRFEKSPYLLQHADNPVDWYPWGEEAFERAKKENKPIFLSIGYSTCHWCHVMEEESFEDTTVAKIMNETFVSIKVDREERPDIDNVYMTVCQMLTGSGGWPLTIIMTPDKKPFFAGTYFPRESRFGRTGLLDLIPKMKQVWIQEHDKIINSANQISDYLKNLSDQTSGDPLGESTLKTAYQQFLDSFDKESGGFGEAPKFPVPHNLTFLLHYWKRSGDEKALQMVEKTLQAMRNGGIYDHLGFGFHRYSTDSNWLVPHFEKMLYDQATLSITYTEAYQATGKNEYKNTVQEIITYILRVMTSPAGGFYSAEDADSDSEEGIFYLLTEEEIRKVLDKDETDFVFKVFHIEKSGNFEEQIKGAKTGKNILFVKEPFDKMAATLKLSRQEFENRLDRVRNKLFIYREKRIHPHKDDKVLTDWNGLMIAALAKASQVFDEPKYAEAAKRAADFILTNMRTSDGRLLHRYREGHSGVQANIDDYAFLIWGLLELYEATFEVIYLKTAAELNKDLIKHFWDDKNGGFYFTPDDGENLLVRPKEVYDGALPSGNSVAMLNLIRLARITANPDFEDKTAKIGQAFSKSISSRPSQYSQLLIALDFALGPSYEVVISGNSQSNDTNAMLKTIREIFIPNKVVILRPTEQKSPEIIQLAGYTKYQFSMNNKATAYVCLNYLCNTPTNDIKKMLSLLNEK